MATGATSVPAKISEVVIVDRSEDLKAFSPPPVRRGRVGTGVLSLLNKCSCGQGRDAAEFPHQMIRLSNPGPLPNPPPGVPVEGDEAMGSRMT